MEYDKKISKFSMGTYDSAYLVIWSQTRRKYILKEIHYIKKNQSVQVLHEES